MTCVLVTLLVASGITYNISATGPKPVQLKVDQNKVFLRAATVDVRFADSLKGVSQLPVDGGYYLVHFTDKLSKETGSKLVMAISQGNVVERISYDTYLCRLYSSQMGSLNSIKEINWIGLWKPEYKISPDVNETNRVTSTSEGMAFDGDLIPKFNKPSQPEDEFLVTFFKGENVSNYIEQIRALGGTIHSYTSDRMHIRINKTKLPQIATINGVYFIEKRYLMTPVNDNDTWIVQTYILGNRKVFNNGITGAWQIIALSDTGIDADHLFFWDPVAGLPSHNVNFAQRKVVSYYNWYQTGVYVFDPGGFSYYNPGDGYMPTGADPMFNVYDWDIEFPPGTNYAAGHGSHTSGTAAGEWLTGIVLPTWGIPTTPGYDFYEGNAFGAKLVFQDLGRQDSPYIYGPPDLNDPTPAGIVNGVPFPGTVGLFPQAMADGAFIHSNSWGGGAFGDYNSYSRDIDEMMWANPNFLVIFSNGNDGPGAVTITPPATAKDCLSAGAAETSNDGYGDNSEDVASFSSWGPAEPSGWTRVKPDVCAPGMIIFSAWSDNLTPGPVPNDGLIGYQGTSMSAPGLAGCCALVREYFMTGWYNPVGASSGFMAAGAFTPTAAMMKAIMINSAQPMTGFNTGGTIPGLGQGWGRVLLDNSLYFTGDVRSLLVDDNTAGLDGAGIVRPFFKAYTVTVAAGQVLDVTCVYTEPPGAVGSAAQMVNYMYVEVDHPNGSTYYLSGDGNFSNGWTVPNTSFIYPDVVQKVRFNVTTSGVYTIYVVAFMTDQVTPGWNVQPYALAASANFVQSQGFVQFNQDYYTTSGPLTMTLTDRDLAGNGTATVTLSSAGTGDSETATLNEIGGATGIFGGSFPCSAGAANPGNGNLEVSDPDTLTVTYNDAAPAGVRTDTAFIDSVPPVISNVAHNTCNGASVEITWDTDENSNSVVHWGPTAAYGNTVSDPTMTLNHYIAFNNLTINTTYYYEVCSTDQAGNTGCSGPYTFTTPLIYTPPQFYVGYVSEFTYGVVLDDDDMWTGHNTSYAGIRHGVFQFCLDSLPANAYITSAQVVIFKQADFLDGAQADIWSCNLINFFGDLSSTATYANIHGASVLATLNPTWTTAQLIANAPGTMYTLTPNAGDIADFNPGGFRADKLTFRMDGATTGDSIMSWDTGFRQDLGSLGVCYRPQLIITLNYVGDLKFDVPCFPPTGPVLITLTDQDLCGTGTVNVTLTAAISGDSETVTLTEVGTTGVFKASFPCDPASGLLPNDGILFVTENDTLTVTYTDAAPAGVRTATAKICVAEEGAPYQVMPSLCPLAKHNIQLAQDLKKEAEDLLAEARAQGLDTSEVEKIMEEAALYLENAEKFCAEGTNCIPGNWNALKAMELYKQAIDELKKLLGK